MNDAGEDEGTGPELQSGPTRAEAQEAAQGTSAEAVSREVPAVRIAKTHSNLDQEVIEVTSDRAKLVLADVTERLAKRREWSTPLGLVVGLTSGLLTANYKDVLGVDANTVEGIVIAADLVALFWLITSLVHALRTPSTEKVIEEALDALKHKRSA